MEKLHRWGIVAILLLAVVSCQKEWVVVVPRDEEPKEEWIKRTPNFRERYVLEEMVVLSRHNIRSPLSENGSVLSRVTSHEWFKWTSRPSELSVKGGELEKLMGAFFRR